MQSFLLLQLLILLILANGTPPIVKWVPGDHFSQPLDGGVRFFDGQRLFGSSKTIRGVLSSILVTSACAPVIGLEWSIGVVVGSTAMMGDLFSSFVKRRFHLPPGSRAIGLDQIPESLFPLLACRTRLALTLVDIGVGLTLFFVGALTLSPLLYKLRLRRRAH